MFPKAGIRHLVASNSDHKPILLDTHLENNRGRRPFRFEAMWARDESSIDVMEKAWWMTVEGSQNFKLLKKCQNTRKEFIAWNKSCFGIASTRIKELENKLKALQELAPTQENIKIEAALHLELNEWLEREELKWKQKSRDLWLKEGDRNSKFFHASTLVRRRRNFIIEIQLNNGQWIHSREDIEQYFAAHFQEVYQTTHPQIPQDLEGLMSPCISDAENMELACMPSPQEIKAVIWEMHPLKAPGPDGFPGIFFKKYWNIVGDQTVSAIQSFFREGWMLQQFNHTFITLIPKKAGACNFNYFRPISLCNFYYKVIAKILVNRLRPLLSKIIDPAQGAFVPQRWIAENIILAQEVVHSFKKSKRKKGFIGFKLDFQKAYDKVKWSFIIMVLKSLGFNQNVTDLIFQCISIVKYTLLLNGSISRSINPSRGIKQGDPLSPYLFILCSEVLSRLVNREVESGNLKGVKIAPRAPPISKLLYADDVLLFCGAQVVEVGVLMRCVDKYCKWSGQAISMEKSGFFVSKRVHGQFSLQIRNQWGFKKLAKDGKYLGLPLFLSPNKSKDFSFVKEKLEARVSGWKCKSLSWMG